MSDSALQMGERMGHSTAFCESEDDVIGCCLALID